MTAASPARVAVATIRLVLDRPGGKIVRARLLTCPDLREPEWQVHSLDSREAVLRAVDHWMDEVTNRQEFTHDAENDPP
jgi:hypothetical protein